MKVLSKLFVAAFAVTLLAGCKGGKSAWTEEEKKIFEDYLYFELPIFAKKNLKASFDEAKGIVLITGDAATADDVKEYADLLSSKDNGYIKDDAVGEDLSDLISLKNGVQLRKNKGNYAAEDVVAVGLDKDGKFTVAATITFSYWGMDSLYSGAFYGFTQQFTYADLCEASDEMFEMGNAYVDDNDQDVYTYQAGDFVYIEENANWEAFGITEYNYLWPWTNGNVYSEDFLPMCEYTFVGASADEKTAFVADMENEGYALAEAATEQNPYDEYKKEVDDGNAFIEVYQDDVFFEDGTSAITICYFYVPTFEE